MHASKKFYPCHRFNENKGLGEIETSTPFTLDLERTFQLNPEIIYYVTTSRFYRTNLEVWCWKLCKTSIPTMPQCSPEQPRVVSTHTFGESGASPSASTGGITEWCKHTVSKQVKTSNHFYQANTLALYPPPPYRSQMMNSKRISQAQFRSKTTSNQTTY